MLQSIIITECTSNFVYTITQSPGLWQKSAHTSTVTCSSGTVVCYTADFDDLSTSDPKIAIDIMFSSAYHPLIF